MKKTRPFVQKSHKMQENLLFFLKWVGGHLFAIAVDNSIQWGYDGVIFGFALKHHQSFSRRNRPVQDLV